MKRTRVENSVSQILTRKGVDDRILPRIPFFVEGLYALGTSILFHPGVTEPQALKPSYFKFMSTVTGSR